MAQTLEFDELVAEAKQLVRGGKYRQALETYQQAEVLDPESTAVLHGLGTVCFLLGNFPEAIDYYRKVNLTDPLRGAAFINLGTVYNRSQRYEEAVGVLRRGIRLDPNRAEGYFNLGIAHKGLGQLDLAAQAYREATRLNPRQADAFLNLGNLYLEKNQLLEAITQFKRALASRPHFERAEKCLKDAEALLAKRGAKEPADKSGNEGSKQPASSSGTVSDEERAKARAALHTLAAHGEELVRQYIEVIQSELGPALKNLENSFLKPFGLNEERSAELEKFRTAVAHFENLRRKMRDHFNALSKENQRF